MKIVSYELMQADISNISHSGKDSAPSRTKQRLSES